jgi:hypothetical protein
MYSCNYCTATKAVPSIYYELLLHKQPLSIHHPCPSHPSIAQSQPRPQTNQRPHETQNMYRKQPRPAAPRRPLKNRNANHSCFCCRRVHLRRRRVLLGARNRVVGRHFFA